MPDLNDALGDEWAEIPTAMLQRLVEIYPLVAKLTRSGTVRVTGTYGYVGQVSTKRLAKYSCTTKQTRTHEVDLSP